MRWNRSTLTAGLACIIIALMVAACNLPSNGPSDSDIMLTSVAQTIAANQTAQAAPDTDETAAAEETEESDIQPTPTPTLTQAPTETEMMGVCDQAVFVEDVTIPEESLVEEGEDFVKTWRVTNTGTCTWTTEYSLEFVAGAEMDAPLSVPLATSVVPNETTDLTIIFTAPTAEGTYTGFWALVNADGQKVPIDNLPDGNLKVAVKVNTLDEVAYDFAEKFCRAHWSSLVKEELPCPVGYIVIGHGYIMRLDDGKLEDGTQVNDYILVTRPDNGDTDGYIMGTYPPFLIENGDHFTASIGCASDGFQCNLYFDLKYQIGSGAIRTLETWYVTHNNDVTDVDVDLSELAGQSIKIILMVRNINSDLDNEGYWYHPRIMR